MEMKIECNCGAKYKFDVEPVNNRMPMPVNCPSCGADGTAQANAILQQLAQAASAPSAEISSDPVAPHPAPTGGLRIHKPGPAPAAGPVPSPPPVRFALPAAAPKARSKLMTVLSTCFAALVIGFGLWRFGTKWFKRLSAVAEVAQALGTAAVDSGGASSQQNLWQEDCVVLFVRHTNHVEIAQVCKDYWKDKLRKGLTVTETDDDEIGEREYCIFSAHNGYVRLVGGLEWPQPHYEGLAQHLSQRFATLVFETRDVDFSGAYHFGVYEAGTRKFHAQMDVKIARGDLEEVVTTDGNDWAIAHGFNPGPEGFKEFHLGHADEITQKMGMKLWDQKEDEKIRVLILKEIGG